MSTRHIDRAFNAVHAQLNERAAELDPEVAESRRRVQEEDRLRKLGTKMTAEDVIQRITLHHRDKDYFSLMELPPPEADALGRPVWDVDHKDISRSYRRLSVLVHPDKNPGPDARQAFEALKEAYSTLRDPDKLDTLLQQHLEAAIRRRREKEAGASLDERVALNAAQTAQAAALRKQEGSDFQAHLVDQLKARQARSTLKRQRAELANRRAASRDMESGGRAFLGEALPGSPPKHAPGSKSSRVDEESSEDEEERRRRRAALAKRQRPRVRA